MTRRAIVIPPALPTMYRIEPDGARPVESIARLGAAGHGATAHVALPDLVRPLTGVVGAPLVAVLAQAPTVQDVEQWARGEQAPDTATGGYNGKPRRRSDSGTRRSVLMAHGAISNRAGVATGMPSNTWRR